MKTIKYLITGTTPIMLNNPQTVNPMNEYTKELKKYTSKRTKTDEDQNEIFHLKFLASVYQNNRGQYIIPSMMQLKAFEEGAKEIKLGKKILQSVIIHHDGILKFKDNGCTPEELWQNHNEEYVDIRAVGIMKAKVVTARFIIPEWSFEGELSFDETQINDSEVWDCMYRAGIRHGMGTYRQCFGRFSVEEIK